MKEEIIEYARKNTTPVSEILYQLTRETHLTQVSPQMLAGTIQGAMLQMISRMIRPNRILEIGTFTGYSAICLAAGLTPPPDLLPGKGRDRGGVLHTIEINPELESIIRKYLHEASLTDAVVLHIGDAMKIIPTLDDTWDLVYLDADKPRYPDYYNLLFPRIRPGGFILADNVLWDGKVLDPPEKWDKDTRGITAFNQLVQLDTRVENLLLPVRDGLMIIRKI
ncbi:MAG: O-methyltransferase [Bacteroidales bacterium]|nr:O-methyltransferase [Bacteroidales bacterium]